MVLSEEQLRIIEANRQKALQIRAQKQKERQEALLNANSSTKTIKLANDAPIQKGQCSSSTKLINQSRSMPCSNPSNQQCTISLKISLKSKTRVSINFPYNATICDVLKQVPSATFDPLSRWTVDILHYRTMLSKLHNLKETHKLNLCFSDAIPTFVLDSMIRECQSEKLEVDISTKLPKKLYDSLYNFQKLGIEFGIQKNGRCLIADDMGLGKTIQAIGISYYYKDEWPLLIICPSSLRFQWKNSILQWLDDLRENDIEILMNSKFTLKKRVLIVSYDLLNKIRSTLIYNVVIVDESHFIKNENAQRSKLTRKFVMQSKRCILLSGTPALNRPIELFSQVNAIDQRSFPNRHHFGMRYCDGKLGKYGFEYQGCTKSEELSILLGSTVMIRRLKDDVLNELPPKRRSVIHLDVALAPDKNLKHMFNGNLASFSREKADRLLFSWYQETAKAKYQEVCRHLKTLIADNKKFICFAHHRFMMDGISNLLENEDCDYIRIDGSTPPSLRNMYCKQFQNNPKCRVALIAIKAAGFGLNLTAAQLVVFSELYYNPGILVQAEDRAHRIGQSDSVLVQYLIAKGTADDKFWPMINMKLSILNNLGLCKDNFSKASIVENKEQKLMEEYFSQLVEEEESKSQLDINTTSNNFKISSKKEDSNNEKEIMEENSVYNFDNDFDDDLDEDWNDV